MTSVKRKKGFTLMELTITMAVVSVVLAVVVMFISLINSGSKERIKLSGRMEEIDKIKTVVTDWFYHFDNENYEVGTADTSFATSYDLANDEFITRTTSTLPVTLAPSLITSGIISPTYALTFSGNTLTAQYSSYVNDDITVNTQYITAVLIDWNPTRKIMKCTLVYGENNEFSQSFVLFRHA